MFIDFCEQKCVFFYLRVVRLGVNAMQNVFKKYYF